MNPYRAAWLAASQSRRRRRRPSTLLGIWRHLVRAVRRAIPVLRHLERAVHPRWHTPLGVTKRVVGVVVLLLTVVLLLAPVSMIQVVPALVIVMISLAYIEEDGILLSIALLIAVALLAITGVAVWKMVASAVWIGRSWL